MAGEQDLESGSRDVKRLVVPVVGAVATTDEVPGLSSTPLVPCQVGDLVEDGDGVGMEAGFGGDLVAGDGDGHAAKGP